MWSIHLLLNKLLKPDEENFEGSAGNHFNFVETYSIEESSNNGKHETSVLSHFVEVPHINQQHTWDCGLACVLMILRALGVYDCNIQELEELCCTTRSFVRFTYCTVTLGANPDFSVERFYKEAREAGIDIEVQSVNADQLVPKKFLTLSCLENMLLLLDQYKLSHSQLEDACVSDFYSGSPGYTGHYVVICGYDAVTNEFEIRDPASSRKHERVTSWCLEQALSVPMKIFCCSPLYKSYLYCVKLNMKVAISLEKGGTESNPSGFFSL
ncbi:Guanylyl cyclase 1 [Sesamum angolense]|uniref:Guanylyl cyclase 1 n=1 Tax=Sesamum angolense TaxID=2727404 RepID=A0AAE1X292_9LAMI|nr:Guanylyl cyclase 1 [Sesamum angolense]